MEGNKLVSKISSLVEEDRIVALSKVLVRVNELREHFGFLSFGEIVELVYALNKLFRDGGGDDRETKIIVGFS